MFEQRPRWTILFGTAVGLSCAILMSTTYAEAQTPPPVQVGKCRSGTPSYSTIQAAVNAVATGALVYVCPGIYPEQIAINKNLSLQGIPNGTADASVIVPPTGGLVQNATDPSPASANPSIAAQIFVQGPATVNLSNLLIDGGNNQLSGCTSPTLVGVYYQNASGTLMSLNVRNEVLDSADAACASGLGMYFEADTATSITVNISTLVNFQKNGMTANGYGNGSPGPVVYFWSNEIVGRGRMAGTAQNGVQIGFGATGKMTKNVLADFVSSSAAAATGVLVYSSNGFNVNSNQIGNAQVGVAFVSDPIFGNADSNNVNSSTITSAIDGVSLCSNTNVVKSNQINSATDAGVKVDTSCTEGSAGGSSGNGNSITNNTVNGGCAGILAGTGTGNVSSPNSIINAFQSLITGSTCTPPPGMPSTTTAGRPLPFR
jgi:hypothetical protein